MDSMYLCYLSIVRLIYIYNIYIYIYIVMYRVKFVFLTVVVSVWLTHPRIEGRCTNKIDKDRSRFTNHHVWLHPSRSDEVVPYLSWLQSVVVLWDPGEYEWYHEGRGRREKKGWELLGVLSNSYYKNIRSYDTVSIIRNLTTRNKTTTTTTTF